AVSALGIGLGTLQLWALYQFRAGRAALERYHHAEAREHLQNCLKVWPTDGDALLLAARANRRLDEFHQAEELLEGYRRSRGQTDDLVLERVLLRVQRGEVDAGLKVCQKRLAEGDPATPLVLEALVQGYMRMYRPGDATYYLDLWLERQPDNVRALFFQGHIFDEEENRQG